MAARKAKPTAAKRKTVTGKAKAKPGRKTARRATAKPKTSAKTKKAATSGLKKADRAAAQHIDVSRAPFQLPERFDSAAAASVLDGFKRLRGSAITVDASMVRRVGAQGLQILLSATRTWASDGHSLSLENPSAELVDAAQLLGLSHSELSISGSMQ